MKKIILSILIALLIIPFLKVELQAEALPDNSIDYFGETTWSLKQSLGRYFFESDYIQITNDYFYIDVSKNSLYKSDGFTFVHGTFSSVVVYQYVEGEIIYDSIVSVLWHENGQETDDRMFAVLTNDLTTAYNFGNHKNMFVKIRMQLDTSINNFQQISIMLQAINSNYRENYFDVNVIGWNDMQNPMTLLDLPTTVGTPFDATSDEEIVSYQKYGSVDYTYLNGDFTIWLEYFGSYTFVIQNITFEDANFLNNVYEVYYYTEDGDRYLYFTYKESDNFLLAPGDIESKAWSGFTIWNLTTNEIQVTQRAWALAYTVAEDLEAYSYFYLPDVPMDDLLSVSVTYDYRIGKKGLTTLWSQKYTEWQTAALVLEKDAESMTGVPQWSQDMLIYSTAAVIVGSILSIIPGTQPIGIPIAAVGSSFLVAATAGILYNLAFGNVDEIQKINYPSASLVESINDHFTEIANKPINISGQPIYKLHIGSFTGVDHNYVEFDSTTYKYTEIVWTNDGQAYFLEEDYIDTDMIVDKDYLASRPEETNWMDGLLSSLIMAGVTLFFIFMIFKTNALANPKNLLWIVPLYVVSLWLLGAF